MHKIVIENVSSPIKNYIQIFEFDHKFRIVASRGLIHWEEGYKIEMKKYFWYF